MRATSPKTPPTQARADLLARLSERKVELEQAVLTRISEIPDPRQDRDPEYVVGIRRTVISALDFWLRTIEQGTMEAPDVPAALLIQARLAARAGVRLDTVLRRYAGGYALVDMAFNCALHEGGRLGEKELNHLVRARAAAFDRTLAAISDEYQRHAEMRRRPDSRLETDVSRILDGSVPGGSQLPYDFTLNHVGLLTEGTGAKDAVRTLADKLDCQLLLVRDGSNRVWAWLGTRRHIAYEDLRMRLAGLWPEHLPIAVGELSFSLAGWRLTHRQAKAAFVLAIKQPSNTVHYRDVCLAASILQDDLAITSLEQIYLAPLQNGRDDGQLFRDTLRAYFAAEGNGASAAAALGVTRQTVLNRLRTIEHHLGQRLTSCAPQLESALEIDLWTAAAATAECSNAPAGRA